ncbi:MBL fold metallo-hydrolase [Neobacillus sp. LXY-1]|uniref:MBL fold metallo-hydrolase n=1 Tax=Neobacillus sp. LXY-1 TaxID=3379133 RepID=UPI003EE24C41
MLVKKNFAQDSINGVRLGNGSLSLQGVKLNVHCFFLDGVLIDAGARSLEKGFISFFKQLEIQQVVMTHYHEDHTGCAAFLQKELEVPLYMNAMMIDYCKKKPDYPLYRQLYWGRRRPFRAQPIEETFTSRNATWTVIKTPGHSKDHLAFLNNETGQLFTGDLYCQEKTKVILREESIPDIIESLKRILTFDFEDVFCCHAGYLNDGRTALKGKLEYLLDLQGEIVKLNDEGKTPEQINATLFPRKYPIVRFSSGEWDSVHIVNSVLFGHQKTV